MSPAESVEERLRDLEKGLGEVRQAVWGVRGENGLTQSLRGLREDIGAWRKEDSTRRESSQRALAIALLAATVSLIGTVAALLTVLSVGH